jgi:hypothetical protein
MATLCLSVTSAALRLSESPVQLGQLGSRCAMWTSLRHLGRGARNADHFVHLECVLHYCISVKIVHPDRDAQHHPKRTTRTSWASRIPIIIPLKIHILHLSRDAEV